MTTSSVAAQAVGLFLVTNIDDVIVLSLFFARGAGQPGTTRRIVAGQYLGFGAILAASVAATLGAGLFLSDDALAYFGLLPLGLGVLAGWRAWRGDDDDDDDDADRQLSTLAVAAVTLANGGDNVGVYVPVFVSVGSAAVVAYCAVFLLLVAGLVFSARFVATREPVAEKLERWESVLFPVVLIGLGVLILVEGGAFGL